jgi:hypothetical protein
MKIIKKKLQCDLNNEIIYYHINTGGIVNNMLKSKLFKIKKMFCVRKHLIFDKKYKIFETENSLAIGTVNRLFI